MRWFPVAFLIKFAAIFLNLESKPFESDLFFPPFDSFAAEFFNMLEVFASRNGSIQLLEFMSNEVSEGNPKLLPLIVKFFKGNTLIELVFS